MPSENVARLAALLQEYEGGESPPTGKAGWLLDRLAEAPPTAALLERMETARRFIIAAIGNLAEQRWETVETELGAALAALSEGR